MWILSIDTATKVTGLAVHFKCGLVAESFLHTGKTHSERLMPMVLQLLEQAGIGFGDLEAVAVSSGPGSFTGLRIGMATAKGIAQVRKIPLIGINTLDALAQNGLGFEGLVAPVLDARKDEVYTALYGIRGREISLIGQYEAVSPAVLAERLGSGRERVLFVGDAVPVYRELLEARLGEGAVFLPDSRSLPRGAHVGALAAERLARGERDDIYTLKPFYIRPSEAEATWAKKFGQGG